MLAFYLLVFKNVTVICRSYFFMRIDFWQTDISVLQNQMMLSDYFFFSNNFILFYYSNDFRSNNDLVI